MGYIKSIWEAAATMRLRNIVRNWRSLYDFSIIDFTDVHPDDGEAEDRVVLQMYR